jgi:asparagine synthase (glutamine-hydrolysing)
VTVALSGDGGDEVFGGYRRYVAGIRLGRRLGWIPVPIRRGAARVADAIPPRTWDRVGAAADLILPASRRGIVSGNSVEKLASVLALGGLDEIYTRLVSTWPDPGRLVLGGREPGLPWRAVRAKLAEPAERMMLLDLLGYLPDDILTKVDRASMGVSLEVRTPLLDHRLVELAWRLPLRQKIRGGEGKWLLRQILAAYVPRSLFTRPKQGFGVPIDDWLRGPLRDWAEDLLSEQKLAHEGFLDQVAVRSAFREHQQGRRNRQHELWAVLMFESWLQRQREERQA